MLTLCRYVDRMSTAIYTQGPLPGYLGSKGQSGTWQKLLNLFPGHSIYIEAFLGNGEMLRRKPPALISVGIDLDPVVTEAWQSFAYPGLRVMNTDSIEWLWTHRDDLPPDALVYCDPPYHPDTRTSEHGYNCELTPKHHERLLEVVNALPCSVVVSHYPHDLYEERLEHWRRLEYTAMTRGDPRQEVAWYRYSLATFGAIAPVRGKDFREREKKTRKRDRWQERFAKMPRDEQDMILRSLIHTYHEQHYGWLIAE